MMRRVSGFVSRFLGDRNANVATLVGISAIPLIGLTGFGIDYGYMLSLKAKLDQAADAAAVAGATTASTYLTSYSGTSDVWPLAQAAGQSQANAQFQANVGRLPTGTLSAITPSVQKSQTTITSTLTYSFTMKPFLMSVLGVKTMTVAGTSVSKQVLPTNVDVYVVIDNSESMGIGATLSDQQAVYNITGNCAVTCHFSGQDTEASVRASSTSVTLRIDVAKKAVIAGLKTIPTGSNYKVAVYTMSSTLQNVYSLSNDIAGAITAVSNIDLENDLSTGGTNTTYALQSLYNQLPPTGDGLTSQTAQGVVMLITDAVQDSDTKVKSGSSLADKNDANFVKFSPCNQATCWTDTTFATPLTFEAFDPNQCTSFKNAGYTMMTLDVQYLVPPSNLQGSNSALKDVFTYISTYLISSTAANMQACATTNYAYSANTPSDIATAVTRMFGAIPTAAAARLYQ